jgi:hypothetical protein
MKYQKTQEMYVLLSFFISPLSNEMKGGKKEGLDALEFFILSFKVLAMRIKKLLTLGEK